MADLAKPSRFTNNYKEYMAQLNHSLLKISFPLARFINFFGDKETVKIIYDLEKKELDAFNESLQYMHKKILSYADSLDEIRNNIKRIHD